MNPVGLMQNKLLERVCKLCPRGHWTWFLTYPKGVLQLWQDMMLKWISIIQGWPTYLTTCVKHLSLLLSCEWYIMIFLDDAVLVATMSLCRNCYGYWDKGPARCGLCPFPLVYLLVCPKELFFDFHHFSVNQKIQCNGRGCQLWIWLQGRERNNDIIRCSMHFWSCKTATLAAQHVQRTNISFVHCILYALCAYLFWRLEKPQYKKC